MAAFPWQQHRGSFVWRDERYPGGRVTLPRRCCADPQPKVVGDCGQGCCDDYECQNCHKRWRYEWPD